MDLEKAEKASIYASISGVFGSLTNQMSHVDIVQIDTTKLAKKWIDERSQKYSINLIKEEDIIIQFQKLKSGKLKRLARNDK